MTPVQASELAKRICNCFRGTPPLVEWVDVFTRTLTDYDIAVETVDKLRFWEGRLDIDDFNAEYVALIASRTVPAHLEPLDEPRLTREQRLKILEANGAPARFINAKGARL